MSDKRGLSEPVLKPSDDQDLSVWALPNVEDSNATVDDTATNALGKKSQWRYEPPEETEPEPQPLTAQEIEQIRESAYQEGFNQGKEEGFAKGYDEGKAQGHQEGIKTGHEQGVAEGLEEGKTTIEQLAHQWQQQIDLLHTPLALVEQNVEQQILELVVQLTEAVVLQEAKTNPEILAQAISQGIKSLPSQEIETQVLLNPLDIAVVEQQFGQEHIQEQGWRLLPAPQLEQGSCQIENSTSNIDLRIKSRLKQVLESFLQDALHQ